MSGRELEPQLIEPEIAEGAQALAGVVNQKLLAELRLLRGDVENTDHTDPDYLDGINAQDRDLADDLMGISAFGLVVPFARGRLRAAAMRLRAQADELAKSPIMPGEECVHNKSGGIYMVEQRRVSYSRVLEGASMLVLDGRPLATDQIEPYEQFVVYRRKNTGQHFARPARLFDEPGRFSRAIPMPEARP